MAISKENVKLEQRLVRIQNKVAELSAKLDTLLGDKAKDVKMPKPEPEPQGTSSQPYSIKPEHELPEGTIPTPEVPAEGLTPGEAKRQKREESEVDPSTITPPVTPVDDPNNPKTEEQIQKEAEAKSEAEMQSSGSSTRERPAPPPASRTTPRSS